MSQPVDISLPYVTPEDLPPIHLMSLGAGGKVVTREHSHIASDTHPSRISLQIHSIDLPGCARVQFVHRGLKLQASAVPFATADLSFDLTYHSVLFDVIKVNVFKQVILSHSRIAKTWLRLSELPAKEDRQLMEFPLYSSEDRHKHVGNITLVISFTYESTMPLSSSPLSMSFSNSFSSFGVRSHSPDTASISSQSSFKPHINHHHRSSTQSSISSRSSTSSLSYSKRSKRETIDSLSKFFIALSSTGWTMNRIEFGRGLALMQSYYHRYPTAKTHDIITDPQTLKNASYFLNYTHTSYGAAALNYFGYGKLTDVLKINQDYKACVNHLKIEKENMLLWQYDSHGFFAEKPCFFVVYDPMINSIVICIRGTFAVADAITDLNAEYKPFFGGSAHGGCVQSALWMQENYLGRILTWIEDKKATALNIVGHSLGGAIASLLLMMIKQEVKATFGNTFCCSAITFATPPCISHDLVDEWKMDIYSYVNEFDVIPKFSYGSIMDFKELLSHAAQLARDSELSKEEKLKSINELTLALRKENKNPRLLIPGQVFLMYKTSRLDPLVQKKDFVGNNTGNPILDDPEPHYVVERSLSENLDSFDVKADMVFHHFNNKVFYYYNVSMTRRSRKQLII